MKPADSVGHVCSTVVGEFFEDCPLADAFTAEPANSFVEDIEIALRFAVWTGFTPGLTARYDEQGLGVTGGLFDGLEHVLAIKFRVSGLIVEQVPRFVGERSVVVVRRVDGVARQQDQSSTGFPMSFDHAQSPSGAFGVIAVTAIVAERNMTVKIFSLCNHDPDGANHLSFRPSWSRRMVPGTHEPARWHCQVNSRRGTIPR